MKIRSLILAAGAALALTGAVSAQETFNFAGPIVTNGPAGNAANGTASVTFANNFLWSGSLTINGVLTEVNTGTFASEARIRVVTTSNGSGNSGAFSTTGNFTGSINVAGTSSVSGLTGIPINPFGQTWSLRFFESADDGGTSSIDGNWTNLSITFNAFVPPTPPACIDLGNVSNGNYPGVQTGSIASGQTIWYCMNVAPGTSPLDIFTFGSNGTGGGFGSLDTELGLYDSNGFLIATNDDIGGGVASGSYGNFTSRLTVAGGSGTDVNGEAVGGTGGGTNVASLAGGTYYLALSTFNSIFSASGFGVTAGTNSGNYSLTIVPTPGAAAVLGLGVLAMGRRRRA